MGNGTALLKAETDSHVIEDPDPVANSDSSAKREIRFKGWDKAPDAEASADPRDPRVAARPHPYSPGEQGTEGSPPSWTWKP